MCSNEMFGSFFFNSIRYQLPLRVRLKDQGVQKQNHKVDIYIIGKICTHTFLFVTKYSYLDFSQKNIKAK
jgi:hypothetical protein